MNKLLEDRLHAAFKGQFMRPQITQGGYFQINTKAGTEFVPADVAGRTDNVHVRVLRDYLEGTPDDPTEVVELKHGWLARTSAPGYLDCTSWVAFETEDDAADYLINNYGQEV